MLKISQKVLGSSLLPRSISNSSFKLPSSHVITALKKSVSNSCVNYSSYSEPDQSSTYLVFDRKIKKLQKDRAARNVDTSRQVDYLKDEVANRIVDRLLDIKRRFNTVVEVGAGCGHIAKAIDSDIADKLIMCENSSKSA
ncbi:NADH dehydrogenase [ubiquinone] 1 alpha subcomplex assembly factor 5 [Smittium culicis]|uniref:NADH dehydrogenase [ubiquinone] 1 alpha subcomplex assembly factor 5 n=1 Tax=Smittium culicis TaxID=133412 RepID=A0A1R1XDP1_9FUNG|nr:NADH dehydrogenase [ubiquinone] 1 alpha subcomplex assembly factor 5 [Smittium culicis]